jgi:hypothetical protein
MMILRSALYTMTIEAWEAKRGDRGALVALVEDLMLRGEHACAAQETLRHHRV